MRFPPSEKTLEGLASSGEAHPSKPPPARPSPATARIFGMNAKESVPPAGGSRGSLFGGGMQKQEHIAIQSNLPCISGNRTAVMGCSFFNSMGAFIRNILAFVLALYWPLHSIHRLLPIAHCTLHIANCSIRPQKQFPGAGPRAYRICNTVCNTGGLCRGRSGRGRLGGVCLS